MTIQLNVIDASNNDVSNNDVSNIDSTLINDSDVSYLIN